MTLYSNVDCSGDAAAFFASTELFDRQSYTLGNMKSLGFNSDSVSSIAIPYGYAVDLYDGIAFNSETITVDGPFYDDEKTLRHACVSIKDEFNDYTSSLEVYKTARLGDAAKGYWQSITQTETLKFTVRYGM